MRFWNGIADSPLAGEVASTLVVCNRESAWRTFMPPPQLRLGDAFVRGDFEVEGDLERATALADIGWDRTAISASTTAHAARSLRRHRQSQRQTGIRDRGSRAMRILIVSDIHGNRAALDSVASQTHDAVICLGDIVGYGPEPRACVRWVRDHATWVVQGNHDRANADDVPPRCQPDFAWLADAVVPLSNAQLDDEDRTYLRGLPKWVMRDFGGVRVACFHAKLSDPLYGYMPNDRSAWAREVEHVEADLILVGHTHLPLDLTIGNRRVVNPGSVGQPKDGDPRAAFAVLVDGEPRLERVVYPIDETIAALAASDIDRHAVETLSEMLRTGEAPRVGARAPSRRPVIHPSATAR